ncbi:hypothetical protein ACFE04_028909 [Oxalis oulophora]
MAIRVEDDDERISNLLTFTEKGMKKLIDLFKTYEHILSEDSVMDHFKNIINKGKKFAKPELKVDCLETVLEAENSGESEITKDNEDCDSENGGEADSSVQQMIESRNNKSRSKLVKSEQHLLGHGHLIMNVCRKLALLFFCLLSEVNLAFYVGRFSKPQDHSLLNCTPGL